jgi:hypothetical protein
MASARYYSKERLEPREAVEFENFTSLGGEIRDGWANRREVDSEGGSRSLEINCGGEGEKWFQSGLSVSCPLTGLKLDMKSKVEVKKRSSC